MLARTLLDNHYKSLEELTLAIADALADQVSDLPAACVQVDEANVPGSPENAPLAQEAINRILDQVKARKPYTSASATTGTDHSGVGGWKPLVDFLNGLHTSHLVLELAHRPDSDLDALKEIDPKIKLGIGVIDIKVNHVES